MEEPPIEAKRGNTILPDTIFKSLTRREVEEQNFRVSDTEFQHVTRSDLVIEIPEGVNTAGTAFDFCAPITVLEFKSENDPFNNREFVINQIRTGILFLQDKSEDYTRFLNAYVLARYPKKFLDNAPNNGIVFTIDQERPWLRWATVGCQRIALLVCRDLPIERRFYRWLLFAPSDSKRWSEFIEKLEKEGNQELLDVAEQLRPKEFQMLKINAKEIWEEARREGALTPEVEAHLAKERAEGIEILLNDLDNHAYIQMSLPFDHMTDEQVSRLVNGLSGIRIAGLISYLKPYQIERLLPFIKSETQRQSIQNLLAEQ
jgi:hypothetical protein